MKYLVKHDKSKQLDDNLDDKLWQQISNQISPHLRFQLWRRLRSL